MIGRSIAEIAGAINIEQADFRPTAFVTVANHRYGIVRHEHLVVPGVSRIDIGTERVYCRDGFQRAVANGHREQPATP